MGGDKHDDEEAHKADSRQDWLTDRICTTLKVKENNFSLLVHVLSTTGYVVLPTLLHLTLTNDILCCIEAP